MFEIARLAVGVAGCWSGVGVVLVRRWRNVRAGAAPRARAGAVDRRGDRRASGWSASIPSRRSARRGRAGGRLRADRPDHARCRSRSCVGLLRSSLVARRRVSALVERVAAASVRDALAEALGDPSAAARLLAPRAGPLRRRRRPSVRAAGRTPRSARSSTTARGWPRSSTTAQLLEDPELVRAAGAAAGLALRNERLDAELRARYEELRASRTRLVAAGDAARRRIERDLHDGAQQHLVALALDAAARPLQHAEDDTRRPRRCSTARSTELKLGLAELRELARGIHPGGAHRARARGGAGRARRPRARAGRGLHALDERLPPAGRVRRLLRRRRGADQRRQVRRARPPPRCRSRRDDGHVVIDVRDDGIGGAEPGAAAGLSGHRRPRRRARRPRCGSTARPARARGCGPSCLRDA